MKSLLTILFALATTFNVMAQSSNYTILDKSTMQIEGTSTLHDWTCDVQAINTTVNFDADALEKRSGDAVQSLTLTIPVEKIESGKGGMNKKIYGALEEKKHPNITFELTGSELSTAGTNGNESDFQLTVNGDLTIAGNTQQITFPVNGITEEDGSYKFNGSYEINMKDYNVDPPSAMFGTIKSGELVTVSFEFYIAKS